MTDTSVHFGWRLPTWPIDDTPMPAHQTAIDDHLARLYGLYDSIWIADHLVPGAAWRHPSGPILECMTATAFYAAAYPDYTYGQIVLGNSYRPPALLAKMAATLQSLTHGRFILGIGAGWMESEYHMYGYPYPRPGARVDQLEEALQVIKALWTQSPATFEGRHYQVRAAYSNPLPDPPPPILIGGGGEQKTLRVVARHADWWNNPSGSIDEFQRKKAILDGYCAEIGRDPATIGLSWEAGAVAIADRHADALRIAEASPFYRPGMSPVGTPAEVATQIQPLLDLGIRLFILRFADFPDPTGALRFAHEVRPLLRLPTG